MVTHLQFSNPNFLGARFHHIGVACKDIDKTLSSIRCFLPETYTCSEIVEDQKLGATLQLISLDGGAYLELVSGGVVSSFLKRNTHLYHSCFEVDSIERFVTKDLQKTFIPLAAAIDADLFDGRLVQFFQTPLGMVELLERK